MRNIIKAQRYQLKRDYFLYATIFLLVAIYVVLIINSVTQKEIINGGMMFLYSGEMLGIFGILVTLVITGRICGWDFQDKTINYEAVYGHSRSAIFGGRALFSFQAVLIMLSLLLFLPMLYGIGKNGWGPNVDLKDALLRIVIYYLANIRLVSELICLSFILKNGMLATFIGYVGVEIAAIPAMMIEKESIFWTAVIPQVTYVLSYTNQKNLFVDGHEVPFMISELTPSFAAGCILSSILLSLLALIAGYCSFRKSDMR